MKSKILEATYHLIAKQGYEKTSISQISEAVSIQKASLYYHFKNKEEIFLAVVAQYYKHIYHSDLGNYNAIKNKEEYKEFLLNYGKTTLNTFANDRESQLFYAEVNLQSRRLPTLETLLNEYDELTKQEFLSLLNLGKTLNAIPPETDINLEMQTLTALIFGISEMLLYRIEANPTSIWENYLSRLFLP